MKRFGKIGGFFSGFAGVLVFSSSRLFADNLPQLTMSVGGGKIEVASAMKIFFLLTALSVAPAILLTMTSFTRIVIVLSFLRQAIGVHQSPPNQVIVGLSLFLTFFIMSPVIQEVNSKAVQPFLEDKIDHSQAIDLATAPIKKFMLAHAHPKDVELLVSLSKGEQPKNIHDLSLVAVMPAYVLSELKTAFEIGFLIYLPFVLIDLVVSMVLLTTGMMVLPPVIISLPFKLMLFVMVDGWNLIVGSLVRSFS